MTSGDTTQQPNHEANTLTVTTGARLDELESRIAFQDLTIQELNRVIIAQRSELDKMYEAIDALKQRVMSLQQNPVASLEEETPPPHY